MASRASLQEEGPFLDGKYTKKGRKSHIAHAMKADLSWKCPVPPAAPMVLGPHDTRTDLKSRLRI